MTNPKFVETAKWHYAKTVIKLAWRPPCKSFQWESQMIISGVILATCYIPFKFVGLKLLFACQLGQRSQQAYSFFFRNGDMEACIGSRSSKMVNNICQLNSLKSFWIEAVICMIAESTSYSKFSLLVILLHSFLSCQVSGSLVIVYYVEGDGGHLLNEKNGTTWFSYCGAWILSILFYAVGRNHGGSNVCVLQRV